MSGSLFKRKYIGYVLSSLFFLILLEGSLRIYLIHFAEESRFKTYASSKMLERRYGSPRLVPHETLLYTTAPDYSYGENKHNDLGFRGENFEIKKSADVIRIVCLGGSTTYSDGVENYRESYPFQLEQILRKTYSNIEVLNAGVPGYGSYQNLHNYLLRIMELSPDYVILYQGINDLQSRLVWPPESFKFDLSGSAIPSTIPDPPFWHQLSVLRVPLVLLKLSKSHSSLQSIIEVPETYLGVEYYEQLIHNKYPSGIFEKVSVDSILKVNSTELMEHNTRKISNQMNSANTRLVLSTFLYSPDFEKIAPQLAQPEFQEGLSEHNQLTRSLAEELDVALIDLARIFDSNSSMFTDGIHFNASGNRLRAEAIASALIPILDSNDK